MSHAVVGAGGFGLFVFGVLNRLLIVTGLHHILNNIAYFVVGDWHGKTGRPDALLRGRSQRRRVHERVLPGHDVRPARGVPGNVSRGAARSAQGRRRPAAQPGADVVPDRGDRADRVQLHVPRARALRDPRAADRTGGGNHERARGEAGLWLLGRLVRLCAELRQGDEAAAAAAGRCGLCGRVLFDLPLHDPAVRSADAGARAGCARGGGTSGDGRSRGGVRRGAGRGGEPARGGRVHDAAAVAGGRSGAGRRTRAEGAGRARRAAAVGGGGAGRAGADRGRCRDGDARGDRPAGGDIGRGGGGGRLRVARRLCRRDGRRWQHPRGQPAFRAVCGSVSRMPRSVSDDQLVALGARAVVRPGPGTVHILLAEGVGV